MKQRRVVLFGSLLATAVFCVAQAATTLPSGDDILARAAAEQGLTAYSVPVHFDVHMHRPIEFKSGADGVAYYKSPNQAAIAITKIPGPLGNFFKGSYTLDMVPQTWPSKYVVSSVTQEAAGDSFTYILQAVPKADPSVDHVTFEVTHDYRAISAQWFYKDGSSIRLRIENQHMQNYTLPQSETISVAMPKYSLDATATYGTYAINAPVDDSVFQTK